MGANLRTYLLCTECNIWLSAVVFKWLLAIGPQAIRHFERMNEFISPTMRCSNGENNELWKHHYSFWKLLVRVYQCWPAGPIYKYSHMGLKGKSDSQLNQHQNLLLFLQFNKRVLLTAFYMGLQRSGAIFVSHNARRAYGYPFEGYGLTSFAAVLRIKRLVHGKMGLVFNSQCRNSGPSEQQNQTAVITTQNNENTIKTFFYLNKSNETSLLMFSGNWITYSL